jgi:citrate lyase gamma subunit
MTDPFRPTVTRALPPPDEHMLELERLLRLAKVGTHELTSGETTPVAAAADDANDEMDSPHHASQHQNHRHVDAEDLTWRLNESINHNDDDETSSAGFMANDKEALTDEEVGDGVVVVANEAAVTASSSSSSSSSEGSGVLVEAPPQNVLDEGSGKSDSKKPLIPLPLPPQQQHHHHHQLSLLPKTPKFHFFYSDDETKIPKQLNAIQQQSVRNRQAFQSRIHAVELHIADLTARLANEEMDRQVDVRNAVQTCIHLPLQAVLEHITTTTTTPHATPSLTCQWIAAERDFSALEAKLYHGMHVELWEESSSQPTKVDLDALAVEIREEALVTAKKEGSVARRWETEAGILARRFLEERTARIASLEVVGNKLNAVDHRKGQELLETIRELRRKLEMEKDERILSDESALDYIVKRTEAVKRAILEAYTDSYDDDF